MGRRIFLTILWISFITYAFLGAPPQQPDTFDLISRLASGSWDGINPAIIALFNAMGIWPMIYGCWLLVDGHEQRVAAWPFAIASFAVGAFALLPYLILRTPSDRFVGSQSRLLAVVESRWVGALLSIGAAVVLAYGLWAGDWSSFAEAWRSSRFIHVMSLDFGLLWLLVPALLGDDMARRGLNNRALFWLVVLVPLLGPALYLLLRPALLTQSAAEAEKQIASAS